MARGRLKRGRDATVEQLQAYHRQTARYEGRPVEGFEPTVLELRHVSDMGLPAWNTMGPDVFSACPPEVWDLTTDRDGVSSLDRDPLSPSEWSLDPW
jgi:hypothetical protein